jgi:UDP-N-acetylglucosamine--N-acetylmuramyl-(pentapeptide) pyrophosphoryl-undecaprenol N-acetylglucosamine transferase
MTGAASGNVLVVAGGSGGHIFPAVGLCQDLARRGPAAPRITFVVQKGRQALAEALPDACVLLEVDVVRSPGGLVRLFHQAWGLVGRLRPAWVVGFGGLMTVPFLWTAKARGCRTMIHEQNVIPGRANRLLAFGADTIAVSFEATRRTVPPFLRRKVAVTRFPLRERLKPVDAQQARRSFGLDAERCTLLVLGGSQGARCLNDAVPEALEKSGFADRIQVIHLCGPVDPQALRERYARSHIPNVVLRFLSEMERAYSAADLAVSRAGSGVLHELLFFGVPAVLIPYPYAGAHQRANARAVAQTGAALVMEERGLKAGVLGQLIRVLGSDPMRRKMMTATAQRMCAQQAGVNPAELIS